MARTIIALYCSLYFCGMNLSAQATSNDSLMHLIDTTIHIMRLNATNASKVNWDEVSAKARRLTSALKSSQELGSVIEYLFESIGDFHGAFFLDDSTYKWNYNEPTMNDSIKAEFAKGATIRTSVLDDKYSYIRIPSMPAFSTSDFNKKAQELNDSLCLLLDSHIQGLIIDLRLNGGGAMHPMILGVKQLLGGGELGSFRTRKIEKWGIRGNGFYVDTSVLASINPKCTVDESTLPVVILSSSVTGSAAECFIIAFKGRQSTILLGDKTAGFVTVNNGFKIDERAAMNLSIGYNADRTGQIYTEAITPDITLKGVDNFNNLKADAKIQAALKWLRGHK